MEHLQHPAWPIIRAQGSGCYQHCEVVDPRARGKRERTEGQRAATRRAAERPTRVHRIARRRGRPVG
ncbi:unnamed protein product [Ixodes persulcatus]